MPITPPGPIWRFGPKVGVLWALGGAFLIGISIPLVNAFYGLG